MSLFEGIKYKSLRRNPVTRSSFLADVTYFFQWIYFTLFALYLTKKVYSSYFSIKIIITVVISTVYTVAIDTEMPPITPDSVILRIPSSSLRSERASPKMPESLQ